MSLGINFQILVENQSSKKKEHISLKDWNKLGLLPYRPDIPAEYLKPDDSFTINHIINILDKAIAESLNSESFRFTVKYRDITGSDYETCLVVDLVSHPKLLGMQQLTILDLLNEVMDDFPCGFCLLGTNGKKIIVFLQPFAIEMDNDPDDQDF